MSNINDFNNLQSLKKITEIANLNKDYLENINNLIQQNNNLLENANKFNKLKSIALWVMVTFAAIILAIVLLTFIVYYMKKTRDSIAISNQSDIFLKRVNSEEKNIGKDGMIAFSYQPEKILPIIPSADSIVFDGLKIDVEVYDPLKNTSNKNSKITINNTNQTN